MQLLGLHFPGVINVESSCQDFPENHLKILFSFPKAFAIKCCIEVKTSEDYFYNTMYKQEKEMNLCQLINSLSEFQCSVEHIYHALLLKQLFFNFYFTIDVTLTIITYLKLKNHYFHVFKNRNYYFLRK